MAAQNSIVYGPAAGDSYLVFIPEGLARELETIYAALATARTWGDLRAALPPYVFGEAVEQVAEDEQEAPADDAPFSQDELTALQEGDWPTWPAQHQLEWMPRDIQDLTELVGNRVSGDWLEFPLEREGEIVAALKRHGYVLRRDPKLVDAASGAEVR